MAWTGFQRAVRRVLGVWLGAGALATGYGVVAAWQITGTAPTAVMWWLILPLALVVAFLAATLMVVWEAVPALAAWRVLRQAVIDVEMEPRAGHQPHIVTAFDGTAFDGTITGPVVDEYPPEHTDQRWAA